MTTNLARYVRRALILGGTTVLLVACKADEVEIELDVQQLQAATDGADVMAEFEAVFSNLGQLDNEQRAQVDAVRDILEQYMAIDDEVIRFQRVT